jgi:hypothetical protein
MEYLSDGEGMKRAAVKRHYNIGKDHPMFGKHFSLESRKKISEAQRGEKGNMFGKHHSQEVKERISRTLLGRGRNNGIDKNGYRWFYVPGRRKHNRIQEHRFVMETILGHALTPRELVHHIDFNRLNNDPDNLVIMSFTKHRDYHKQMNFLFEHWLGA